MLDTRMRAALGPVTDRAGTRLAQAGVRPLALTGTAWVVGVAA